MRTLSLVFSLLYAASAFAAETLVTTEDVQSVRFVGETIEGPFFTSGAKVTVLAKEGDWVRVRKGDDYGWVERSRLAENAPQPTLEAPPAE